MQVKLCWWNKKKIAGATNLHELHRISSQTGNGSCIRKRGTDREKTLLPEPAELAKQIFHVVFIKEEISLQDFFRTLAALHAGKDFLLIL